MDDDREITAAASDLIESVVRRSNLPRERDLAALRRELADHFEDAIARGQSPAEIIARFGDADDIAGGFRDAYRPARLALRVAKVVAAALVAFVIALALQLIPHVRLHSGVAVDALYPLAARLSIAVVLAAVAAWELDVEPLCTRLEREPVGLAAVCLTLFVLLAATHEYLGMHVGSLQALVGASTMVAVWVSSLAVLSRADRAYLRWFGGAR
jgi:uncharacterized membrane protein